MNLITAEEFADHLVAAVVRWENNDKSFLPTEFIPIIRQIQADVLRFTIQRIKSDPDIAFAIASIEDLANQLQPLPERKEHCILCGKEVSDWVDPDWASGRICRTCETNHSF